MCSFWVVAQALSWSAQVSHIQQNTKIPVMGHADGICHIYVDEVPKVSSILNPSLADHA
jgi:gamma-glutamyl phosphate reductase